MIKVVTTKGQDVKEFKKYSAFFSWLLDTSYGSVVTVQHQDDKYLERLHISAN